MPAEKLSDAVTGDVAGPASDDHQAARRRGHARGRCHDASPPLRALSKTGGIQYTVDAESANGRVARATRFVVKRRG